MQDILQQVWVLIEYYSIIIWNNIYSKWVIFLLIYLFLLYFVLIPLSKKFLIPLINKTRTNLDDKLYAKNKIYMRFFWFLIWIIIVYKLYFISLDNKILGIIYEIILTITYVLFYLIIHKSVKVIFKFIVWKYKKLITKNIANLLKLMIDVFLITIIGLLILKAWNINITPLLAWAWIFGLAIAMASKNIIENFLSWLIIFADKALNVGDTVILSDDTSCVIKEINVRTTILKTFDGSVVILPNSDFLNQKIINKSLSEISNKKRIEVVIWISYGDDTDKAKELIASYLKELDGADTNSVITYISSLWNRSVDITWRIMVDSNKRSYLMSHNVIEKAYKEFAKNWLTFPFPTYTIDGNEIQIKNKD